ncbi:hypothetical protein DHEL01_v204823 [Diaporthe helianthi]|uniref:Uncharacterized protein n=1 Tax=Diaporthe helianthi TaxID=158607 RepID=A0A2P5I2S8_DIAHE|nr:hypothetical protein DHEL01_v204823 [Diaporthe helianthi]
MLNKKSPTESIAQSMSGPGLMPLVEIQLEAQGRSRRLCASQTELRAILERHEATIQNRWSKKTKTQRQAILLTAWPNMATAHRPDHEAIRSWGRQNPDSTDLRQAVRDISANSTGLEYRELFIWPYINQEDLSQPKILLLLLSARGRHDPCDFAAADFEAMCLGICLCVIQTNCHAKSTMILNGAVGPDNYGKLLAWDEHPDAHY